MDGSDKMVKLKLGVEAQKKELEAATRDVRPRVDELQRLLAVAGWHFRVQADDELRGGSPGWRQTYHAGPLSGFDEHGLIGYEKCSSEIAVVFSHSLLQTNQTPCCGIRGAAAAHARENEEFRRLGATDRSRSQRQKKSDKSLEGLKRNLRCAHWPLAHLLLVDP